ncbi:hypothetical protein V6N12_033684 [Hibiscus sabdariffa]|uniref:Pectin acetylesterase n=1 Tax=Hibiscus sabdariffa TaxID=183260 RepID=A0ABR2A1C7_9ROSI
MGSHRSRSPIKRHGKCTPSKLITLLMNEITRRSLAFRNRFYRLSYLALGFTYRLLSLSDAGFFLDVKDVSLNHTIRSTFKAVVSLQGVKRNLDRRCRKSMYDPELFHRSWVPYSADVGRTWGHCRHQLAACNADQIAVLQGFRHRMLKALSYLLKDKQSGGTFITSCLTHCQSNAQEFWFAVDSPRIHNKTMAEAVGDWYFDRRRTKEIDCGYPCDTCRNLAPLPQATEYAKFESLIPQAGTHGRIGFNNY